MPNNTATAAKIAYDTALDWSARAKGHRAWIASEVQRAALRGDGAELVRLKAQLAVQDNVVRAAASDADSAWRVKRAVTSPVPVVRVAPAPQLRRRFDSRGYITKVMLSGGR